MIATQICLTYFTAFYPLPPILLESRILLGCVLGAASTWWGGLVLGMLCALCARCGKLPKLDSKQLLRPLATLLVVTLVCTAVCGMVAYFLAERGVLRLQYPMTHLIPREDESGFWTVGFMNLDGEYDVEGYGVAPDIEVENMPDEVVSGKDPQLEKAIEYLMNKIAEDPPKKIWKKPVDPDKS